MLDLLEKTLINIQNSFIKIVISLVIIIFLFIIYKIIKKAIHSRMAKTVLRKEDGLLIIKLAKGISSISCIFILIFIWGGNIQNLWVGITSVFGIVAIGFFAVWSILSNIVSGIVIILIKAINISDEIEVMGDGIRGRIENITLFHVILIDENNSSIVIPNNLFIQKIIKVIK